MYDSVAHHATENSHIHCASVSFNGPMDRVTTKLKRLRESAIPKVSIRAMADALEMPPSTYAAYEDPKKFKKPLLPFDLAKRIAGILAPHGVHSASVMELAGLSNDGQIASAANSGRELLEVTGAVAAGIWREQTNWPPEQRHMIEVGPNPYPGSERFALRNEGLSMNRTIPPDSDLECLRVAFGSVEPRPGDLVIVERTSHDLTEMTCKRLDVEGEDWVLRCESYEPEFQYSLKIGRPDNGIFTDDEIRVVAIVLSAQQRHFRAR